MFSATKGGISPYGSAYRLALLTSAFIGLVVIRSAALGAAPSPAPVYRIETFAGTGKTGDIPGGGGQSTEVPFDLPFGVERGPDGDLFVTCVGTHRVLRIDLTSGRVSPVAGNGRRGYAGDGAAAVDAMLNEPYEIRFDSHGNLFIVEMQNHLIRKVDARTGSISTVAGDGVAGFQGDRKAALQARFHDPHSLAIDEDDNIYVSDLANHRVRRIDARSGQIETLIGNGKGELPISGKTARGQPFLTPQGLVVRKHDLWIASVSGHSLWRLDLGTGVIHRIAGTGRQGHSGDGGDPLAATFDGPRGMTMSAKGILYVAEGENNVIRAIDTMQGSISTIAGVGRENHRYAGDGMWATDAPLWQPHGVCEDSSGRLLITDTMNHRVRLLIPTQK